MKKSSPKETRALTVVGVVCALASTAAFFLHVYGFMPMPYFINFVGLPMVILMLIVGLYSWNRKLSFWLRFRAGLLAGVFGLIAYDLLRYVLYKSELLAAFPFHALPIFGSLITGMAVTDQVSLLVGWAYHVWNGMNFAMIYALIAGAAPWYWGLAWAMILEAAMLWAYPSFLAIRADFEFVALSAIGHAAYGIAIGLTASHWAK